MVQWLGNRENKQEILMEKDAQRTGLPIRVQAKNNRDFTSPIDEVVSEHKS